MIQQNATVYRAEAWLECEKCGERVEGRDGYQVTERLAAHRMERHNPAELAGATISPYISGA